jgi:hypothetical protein
MENKPKRSKAIIITIIAILILCVVGFFLFKNKDEMGTKTSVNLSKIFSPLTNSDNAKNLNSVNENSKKVVAQAGENLKAGDNVYLFSGTENDKPIVKRTRKKNNIFGFAYRDVNEGELGEFIISQSDASNPFWNSISNFFRSTFNGGVGVVNNGTTDSGNFGGGTTGDGAGGNTNDGFGDAGGGSGIGTLDGGDSGGGAGADNGGGGDDGDGDWEENNSPKITILAKPARIKSGESSDIEWSALNSTSCDTGSGFKTEISGTFSTGKLTASKTYTITCKGENGTSSEDITVYVDGSEPTSPIVKVTATPRNIKSGEYSTISWTSTNAISCDGGSKNGIPPSSLSTEDGASNGSTTSGSFSTGKLTSSKTFTVTCKGDNSTGSGNAFVYVAKAGLPDLRAGAPTPNTTTVRKTTTFYIDINNRGTAGTGSKFFSIMQWSLKADGSNPRDLSKIATDTILSGEYQTIKTTYKFISAGTYYIRACADKSSQADVGVIYEGVVGSTGENNNCSDWKIFTVTNSMPDPELDEPTATKSTECNDGEDNDEDGLTDINDSGCHTDYDPYIILTYDEKINDESRHEKEIGEVDSCKEIKDDPLVFTSEEQARLDVLLRKFYLLSPTLKTEDDITDIKTQYNNAVTLIDQATELTKACYLQTNFKGKSKTGGYEDFCERNKEYCKENPVYAKDYKGPTTRMGNPYYKKATTEGTYLNGLNGQSAVSSWASCAVKNGFESCEKEMKTKKECLTLNAQDGWIFAKDGSCWKYVVIKGRERIQDTTTFRFNFDYSYLEKMLYVW